MSYTTAAEAAADTTEPAHTAGEMVGRCSATGLDPDAYRGVIAAAVALGGPPAIRRGRPYSTDGDLAAAVADLATTLTAQRRRVDTLADQVHAALATALADAESDDADNAAAGRRRVADCQTALDVLEPAAVRLAYAVERLRAVPDAVGDAYDAPYRLVAAGRALPHDGRWLTGADDRPARRVVAGTTSRRADGHSERAATVAQDGSAPTPGGSDMRPAAAGPARDCTDGARFGDCTSEAHRRAAGRDEVLAVLAGRVARYESGEAADPDLTLAAVSGSVAHRRGCRGGSRHNRMNARAALDELVAEGTVARRVGVTGHGHVYTLPTPTQERSQRPSHRASPASSTAAPDCGDEWAESGRAPRWLERLLLNSGSRQ